MNRGKRGFLEMAFNGKSYGTCMHNCMIGENKLMQTNIYGHVYSDASAYGNK